MVQAFYAAGEMAKQWLQHDAPPGVWRDLAFAVAEAEVWLSQAPRDGGPEC